MLYRIQDPSDRFLDHISRDPVRPHIPVGLRVGPHRDVFVLTDSDTVKAMTCVSYNDSVPCDEQDLFTATQPSVAVFYTIWSYSSGSGRDLIFAALHWIKQNKPDISRFVTLSPKTAMAHNFHLGNGGHLLKENINTRNYEYCL